MAAFLAVAFGPPTMTQALAELPRVAEEADLIELRLDFFQESYDLAVLLEARGARPVVVTLRPTDQGGGSIVPAPERLGQLVRAAELGAEYVDLEWDAATPDALQAVRAAGARAIVSRHDFQSMPPNLADGWWAELASLGPDVVKVVGTALDVRDCLPVFCALRQATLPTVAIGMGVAGLPSRILALREPTCLLTYAAPDSLPGTAPGQLTLHELRSVYHADRLGQATAAYGLLGPHPEPERAAEYNAWFSSAGLDAVAVSFPCAADAAAILQAYRELPVAGWHIHGEHLQRDALSALDEVDAKAQRQAKVNAVVARGETLCGTWVESPREQFEFWTS
jgi:3-dehydroquinate dehydratase/shikimate dehydrogenase